MRFNVKEIILFVIIALLLMLSCKLLARYKKPVVPVYIHADLYKIIDGDTYIFNYHLLPIKIRLAEIDTFESKYNKHALKQSTTFSMSIDNVLMLGNSAKFFVSTILKVNNRYCIKLDKNHLWGAYGRYIGHVYLNDKCDGQTINNKLLKLGYAFKY